MNSTLKTFCETISEYLLYFLSLAPVCDAIQRRLVVQDKERFSSDLTS
jgi:hypothetical protein